ncbi:pyruvate ferrodoxin oxidoreductase [Helicobacter pylori Hp P-1b]|nr:pyruvate ferrodoxin oxidoreductase [Helicobacter pylori Hp P-1b]
MCVDVCPTNPKSLWMFEEQIEPATALTQWPQKQEKKKS